MSTPSEQSGTRLRLYDIVPAFARLIEQLTDLEPDDDAAFETLGQQIEAVQTTMESKAAVLAAIVREHELAAEALQDEADRLTRRAKGLQVKARRLRGYLHAAMRRAGLNRLDARLFTLTIRQNPESVLILDLEAVPEQFKRVKTVVEVDKVAIKAYVKATDTIPPGVEITRLERLEIK